MYTSTVACSIVNKGKVLAKKNFLLSVHLLSFISDGSHVAKASG